MHVVGHIETTNVQEILPLPVTVGLDTAPAVGAGVHPAESMRGYSTNG